MLKVVPAVYDQYIRYRAAERVAIMIMVKRVMIAPELANLQSAAVRLNVWACCFCSLIFALGCQKADLKPPADAIAQRSGDTHDSPKTNAPRETDLSLNSEVDNQHPAAVPARFTAGMQFQAYARWEDWGRRFADHDTNHQTPQIAFDLLLHGETLATIVGVQDLRIQHATVGKRELIPLDFIGEQTRINDFMFLTGAPDQRWHSLDAALIPLRFRDPLGRATQIDSLAGSFTLMTSSQASQVTIADLRAAQRTGAEPLLHDAGFQVYTIPGIFDGGAEALAVTLNERHTCRDVHVLNSSGDPLEQVWTELTRLHDGRTRIFLSPAAEPLPQRLQLQLTLLSDLQTQTVDFHLRNIPIPERPVEPEQTGIRWTCSKLNGEPAEPWTVYAQPRWRVEAVPGDNGDADSLPLEIWLTLSGPQIRHVVALGGLQAHAQTLAGRIIPLGDDTSGAADSLGSQLQPYDPLILRDRDRLVGASSYIRLEQIDEDVVQLDEFKGKLQVVTASQVQTIVIDDVLSFLDGTIEHPLLQQHGIRLKPAFFGAGLNIVVEAASPFVVQAMQATDRSGGPSRMLYCGRQTYRGKTVFSFHAADRFPRELPVAITVATGLQELTVPFEFENLPLPRKPEPMPAAQ